LAIDLSTILSVFLLPSTGLPGVQRGSCEYVAVNYTVSGRDCKIRL